jgi:hypothetical protein
MNVIAAYPIVACRKPMPAAAVRQDAIVSADAREAPARDDEQVRGATLLHPSKPAVCRRPIDAPLAIELDDDQQS